MKDDDGIKKILQDLIRLNEKVTNKLLIASDAAHRAPATVRNSAHAHHLSVRVCIGADRATVTVDNYPPFELSRLLGQLLEVLAMDTGDQHPASSPDLFVPFKTKAELISMMSTRHGRKDFTAGALRQGIYRLRRELTKYGFGGFVESNREKSAYRVTVRSNSPVMAVSL